MAQDKKESRMKHWVVTELDGKEIKGGKFKRFRISKYWQVNLKHLQRKPTMDFILAKNLLELKDKIVKADKNSVVVFDEGIK